MPDLKICHRHDALVLAFLLLGFSPVAGQAKDGRDDDSGSHGVAVAAAACTELPTASATVSARSGGAFTVRDGASAALLCPLPASSSGDGKTVEVRVAYLDSDGPGLARVQIQVRRTELATASPGFRESTVCEWSSTGGTLVGTWAIFDCPAVNRDDDFYHLRVELGSVPGSATSFLGVVVHD